MGALDQLTNLAMGLLVFAIVIAVAFLTLAQTQSVVNNMTGGGNNSTAYTAIGQVITALATVPQWLQIIVVVFVGAIMVGLVTGMFGQRGAGQFGVESVQY
jgi:hypothetical protein